MVAGSKVVSSWNEYVKHVEVILRKLEPWKLANVMRSYRETWLIIQFKLGGKEGVQKKKKKKKSITAHQIAKVHRSSNIHVVIHFQIVVHLLSTHLLHLSWTWIEELYQYWFSSICTNKWRYDGWEQIDRFSHLFPSPNYLNNLNETFNHSSPFKLPFLVLSFIKFITHHQLICMN